MVDLLFKKMVMAGIVAKKKKTSAVLKHYACTGVYLPCTCTCTEVLFEVLVLYLSPSHRRGYVLVLVPRKILYFSQVLCKVLGPMPGCICKTGKQYN